MTHTTNYNLNLPAGTDPAAVGPLNQNFTLIDTYLKSNLNQMASDYDSTETYNTDDIVAYDNGIYKCLDDNVTGTWDSTKWDATTLGEEVGHGGSSVVVNPSGTQDEVLDGIEVDGVNYGLDVLGEISDVAVASFSDGANLPINKCIVDITAVQSGSGDPSPSNIRPISGWSEANLWVQTTVDPTADPTATADFNTTIYGGVANLLTGEGSETFDIAVIDGSNNAVSNGATLGSVYRVEWQGARSIGAPLSDYMSDRFKPVKESDSAAWTIYASTSSTATRMFFGFPSDTFSSAADCNTWFSQNPTQVRFKKNEANYTPFTFDPIPTTNTLEGVNNVYADCGDINELGYFKDGKLTRSVKAIVEAMTGSINTILADAIGEE